MNQEKESGEKHPIRKCKSCLSEIPAEATKCSHCGSFNFTEKQIKNNRMAVYIVGGIFVLIFLLIFIGAIFGGSSPKGENLSPLDQQTAQLSKEQIKGELDKIMKLAMDSGLVTSYEFSDTASVMYIGPIWYTQTVQFKKDFMAKIGTLKKGLQGYSHFEVRDTYSDEKVGELTAFSSSLEVYK